MKCKDCIYWNEGPEKCEESYGTSPDDLACSCFYSREEANQ